MNYWKSSLTNLSEAGWVRAVSQPFILSGEDLDSVTALAATVKEQATQIQKVTAQREASKPAPQVVNNR
jgi:hypothetical protein